MLKQSVLIVEDEKNIGNFIYTTMVNNGYKALMAIDGSEGMSMCTSCCPSLMLLDLGLPDIDGMDLIRQIRTFSNMPIIVISARTQEKEKVEALDLGADDYITKPFGSSELLARIRTALRHSQSSAGYTEKGQVYKREGLIIDFSRRIVSVDDKEIHLTQNEYKLVALLAMQAGKVLTYDYLMHQIWGPYANSSNNQILRVNMANIRRKLEKNPAEPQYILTEIGVGYRMKESDIQD